MAQAFHGVMKKMTNEATPDPLNKQPILDANAKLSLFKNISLITSSVIESHIKSMSKSIDMNLKDEFKKSKLELIKYENSSNESVETSNDVLLNTLIYRIADLQIKMVNEAEEFMKNLKLKLLTPLEIYQRKVNYVKQKRRDFKDVNPKIEPCLKNLEKALTDIECNKKLKEQLYETRFENDKKRYDEAAEQYHDFIKEKYKRQDELKFARKANNEIYDLYTEGLFECVSKETFLANCIKNYLKEQNDYHFYICQHLEKMKLESKEPLNFHPKRPMLDEYIVENFRVSSSIYPNGVSPVIRKLIESIIKQNGLNEEGIFRNEGNQSKINRLIHRINRGGLEYIDFNDYHVHDLACVLKKYLRDLPDSILCNCLYNDWYNAINSSSKIEGYKNVIKHLPRENYENLKYILKFLSCIIENSERNKMNVDNICISFRMSFYNPSYDNQLLNIDLSTATCAFDFMLSNHHELFPGDIDFSQFKPSELLHDSNKLSGKINPPIINDDSEKNNTASIRQTIKNVDSSKKQKKLSPETSKKNNNKNNNNNNNNHPEEIISHSVIDSDRRYSEHSIKKVDNFLNIE